MENTERSFPPHFALLEAGGATLTLQDSTAPEAGFGQASSVEIGFAVDDVEAVRGRFVQRGMQVDAVQQMGWGGGFNALDPDGHRLTIYRMREDES
jgi:predicted enzyme related to lactoylglutathione lyase